jgi:hypothetical protein
MGRNETTHQKKRKLADTKAAGKMVKLLMKSKRQSKITSPEFIHGLNVFSIRLLFCFHEDTRIYKLDNSTNAIASRLEEWK